MKYAKDPNPPARVLKFGGTCLHPGENRRRTVERILEAKAAGFRVVAVVSAMGRAGDPYATDTLKQLLPPGVPPAHRERDALLCCGEGIAASLLAAELSSRGHSAVSLAGPQLGLYTDGRHGDAEIVAVDPRPLEHYLSKGYVVVAAGFQGIGRDGALTTLGRGGSDTAAVAIAAGLGADRVVLYKDVDGLYSADPRVVPAARRLPRIPYDEAAHLASAGARVLHPRCTDLAERHDLPLEVKALHGSGPGTLVTSRESVAAADPEHTGLFAVSLMENLAQVRVTPPPSPEGKPFPLPLFQELAAEGISLDMITLLRDRTLFTVPAENLDRTRAVAERRGYAPGILAPCAKVSLLGGGIHGVPGIMARIVEAVTSTGASVHQSTDTYTVLSVLVEGRHGPAAARAVHAAFRLDRPAPSPAIPLGRRAPRRHGDGPLKPGTPPVR